MIISKKISFLIIIALFSMSFVSVGNGYTDIEYFGDVGDNAYYGVEMVIGDNLTWSFNTYSEEFIVHVQISGTNTTDLSDGLTEDSGVFYALENATFYILFVNMDTLLFRGGFISIEFEVNVEPASPTGSDPNELPIPSLNPMIVIGIIGFMSGIFVIKIKKRMES